MIANARLYSVTPTVSDLWRQLFMRLAAQATLPVSYLEHSEFRPIAELWARTDNAAVFMCGLPYARSKLRPFAIAAPVPSPDDFNGRPYYWSELVVRADSTFQTLEDTFGQRIALTDPTSQAGCWAVLYELMGVEARYPLYSEIIEPQLTPRSAMAAVVDGRAEVAPIDSYAFCLLQKYSPELTSRVRVVARTTPTAIPPLVASYVGRRSLEPLLLDAHNNPAVRSLLPKLLLDRFERPSTSSYDRLHKHFEAAWGFWRTRPFAAVATPAFAALAAQLKSSGRQHP